MTNKTFIPYGKQWIGPQEEKAVLKVLRSARITQGPVIERFEKEVAKKVGAQYGVAVSNGTAALHLACLALKLKPGDEVITSPISFLASSNCVLYAGAQPVFADIDPATLCLNPQDVLKKINRKTKAILTVDMAGHPSEMDQLNKLAKKHKLAIIEDASHALGARYKNKPVGSLADMSIFSFHPVKSITTGEGGVITTHKPELYHALISLRNHGIIRDKNGFQPWYYEMQELGLNYRITDFQCAMGLTQLKKLNGFIQKRKKIAGIYQKQLKNLPWLKLPSEAKGSQSSWHLFPVQINFKKIPIDRTQMFARFKKAGIGLQVHYIPIYKQPYYQRLGYKKAQCPEAEKYYEGCVSLPIFPKMRPQEINRVIREVGRLAN